VVLRGRVESTKGNHALFPTVILSGLVSVAWNDVASSQQRYVRFFHMSKAASVVWWLACWPLVPEFAGSNPAEVVGFFRHMMPSFGGEVKESVPCPRT
jgi:hypothetical protein